VVYASTPVKTPCVSGGVHALTQLKQLNYPPANADGSDIYGRTLYNCHRRALFSSRKPPPKTLA
jgi:hypothetical protein